MRRAVRKTVEVGLPILGTVIVFGAILLIWDNMTLQIGVVALGVLMIQAGIWKLTHPMLPSERRYQSLRREVDYFIMLVRRLNAAALGVKETDNSATRAAFDAAQDRMRESFDRMALLAGKTDEEVKNLSLDGTPVAP